MRKRIAAVAAAVVVVVVAGVGFVHLRREREWAHGGDRLAVQVDVVLAAQDTFEDAVVRLGVPPGTATRYLGADQSVVVQIRWSGSPRSDGAFEVIALDRRVTPARPLTADAGWNSDGMTGSNWASSYEALSRHYEWLAGTAGAKDATAVHAPANGTGTVTAWFRQSGSAPVPFADPQRDIAVALLYVDDGGAVRWARRVFG